MRGKRYNRRTVTHWGYKNFQKEGGHSPMIASFFFVLFMAVIAVVSLAIPTLHLERTEAQSGGQPSGRSRARLAWNQLPISPYRGIWMLALWLFVVFAFNGGKASLPNIDLGNIPQILRPMANSVHRETSATPATPPTAANPAAPSTTPPAATPPATTGSPSVSIEETPGHQPTPTPGQRRRWPPDGIPPR